jgi:hypothetical protein
MINKNEDKTTTLKQRSAIWERIFNLQFFAVFASLIVEILSFVTRWYSFEIREKCFSFQYVFLAKHSIEMIKKFYSIL